MKVLIVTELYPPNCGGGGWSTYNLAKALNEKKGIEAKVLAINQEEIIEDVPVEKIQIQRFPNELAYYQIKKEIDKRKSNYDIIQGQHSLTIPPLGLVNDKPTVGVIRDYWPICYKTTLRDNWNNNHTDCGIKCKASVIQDFHIASLYKFFNHSLRKRLTKKVSFLATKSNFVRDRMHEGGLNQATTVRDFVTEDFTQNIETKEEGDIIFFGKMKPNKGPMTFLEAIPAVLEEYPDQQFTLFGIEGPSTKKVKKHIQENNLEENVQFLGEIPFEEVKQRIKGAKATVHPSQWHEPLSRVCIESMSLGTPVISTPTGGSPEIVKDGETGLIFENIEELSESLKEIQDEDLVQRLSQNAIEEINQNYNKGKLVEEWKEEYEEFNS